VVVEDVDVGNVVLNLRLAVKRKYHPLERKVRNIKSGEDETDWFNLELWGRDAEYAAKYVTKGARVGITGSLASDSWVDRTTNEKRTKYKIVVNHLDLLESKAEADLRGAAGGRPNYSGTMKKRGQSSGGNNYDDVDDYDSSEGPSSGGSSGFFY